MIRVKEDLTGKIFGRWKVLQQAEDYISPKGNHYAQWLCECRCQEHTVMVVRDTHLKSGSSKSCGCLIKETTSRVRKKYHNWKIQGDIVWGKFDNSDEWFCFSLNKLPQLQYLYFTKDKHGYAITYINGKKHYLHKLICEGNMVDHKDRNKLNNTDDNLSPCTPQENNQNSSLYKNHKSGFKGVFWNQLRQHWIAYITYDHRRIYLGSFIDKEDAIIARLKAEQQLFTNSSNIQKDLLKKYNIKTGVC